MSDPATPASAPSTGLSVLVQSLIASNVRSVLLAGGGFLLARKMASGDQVAQLVAVATPIAAAWVWSNAQKLWAHARLKAAAMAPSYRL